MSYKILESNGVEIENIDGAEFNNFSAGDQSGVVGGVLDECKITATSNVLTLESGLLLVSGIRIKITSSIDFSILGNPAEKTLYQLIAKVSLSTTKEVSFDLFVRFYEQVVQDKLFLLEKGEYELELAQFYHNTDGSITNLRTTANIILVNNIKNIENKFNYLKQDIENDVESFKEEIRAETSQNQVVKNTNKINAINNVLIANSFIDKKESILQEQSRKVGGEEIEGLSVLDESYATINKIEGDSVGGGNLIPFLKLNENVCVDNEYVTIFRLEEGGFRLVPHVDITEEIFIKISKSFSINCGLYCLKGAVFGKVMLSIVDETDNSNLISDISGNGTRTVISTSSNVNCSIRLKDVVANESYYFYPMLAEGELRDFKPFFTGIKNADIIKIGCSGTNLFKFKEPPIFDYATASRTVDGGFKVTIKKVPSTIQLLSFGFRQFFPAGKYFVSGTPLSGVGKVFLHLPFQNGFTINELGTGQSFELTNDSFVTPYFGIYSSVSVGDEYIFYPMLNFGESSLPFENPKQSSLDFENRLTLGKWDYIEDNKLVKCTGLIEFDGTEKWVEYNSTDSIKTYWTNALDNLAKDYSVAICSNGYVNNRNNRRGEFFIAGGITKTCFCVEKNAFYDVELWKEHLAFQKKQGNPISIAYQTITPEIKTLYINNEYQVFEKGKEEIEVSIDENYNSIFNAGGNPKVYNTYFVLVGGKQ